VKYIRPTLLLITLLSIAVISSCDKNSDLLLFSIDDDVALGMQVAAEIESNPDQFPILDRTKYAEAYAVLDGMLDDILSSGAVTYRDEFVWELHIIHDQALNAFTAPGGYIYVYTGLIYFLDREDDLAGVMSHEIAHSDRRHVSKALQRQYRISVLKDALNGGQSEIIRKVTGSLVGAGALKFSRDAEIEADEFSVEYLSDTDYACNGGASFFAKLIKNQETFNPEFLSIHPGPDNRVGNINMKATDMRCNTTAFDADGTGMDALQALLP